MTKYATIDSEGWRSYTLDEPETEDEIKEHFWSFDEARTNTYEEFTLDYIREIWNVEFEEIKDV